jgi:hypothetical protein
MLNSGNNDREQNWLLLSPRVKTAQSDLRATLGCHKMDLGHFRKWTRLLCQFPFASSFSAIYMYIKIINTLNVVGLHVDDTGTLWT